MTNEAPTLQAAPLLHQGAIKQEPARRRLLCGACARPVAVRAPNLPTQQEKTNSSSIDADRFAPHQVLTAGADNVY